MAVASLLKSLVLPDDGRGVVGLVEMRGVVGLVEMRGEALKGRILEGWNPLLRPRKVLRILACRIIVGRAANVPAADVGMALAQRMRNWLNPALKSGLFK